MTMMMNIMICAIMIMQTITIRHSTRFSHSQQKKMERVSIGNFAANVVASVSCAVSPPVLRYVYGLWCIVLYIFVLSLAIIYYTYAVYTHLE